MRFVRIVQGLEPLLPLLQGRRVRLVFGHPYLSERFEAAVAADQIGDAMPQFQRRQGRRNFRLVARQRAHATGIDAGGVAADVILFDYDCPDTGACQMQGGPATVQPTTDDQDIGRSGIHRLSRTTASIAASVWGSAASSPSVIGLIGKRSR